MLHGGYMRVHTATGSVFLSARMREILNEAVKSNQFRHERDPDLFPVIELVRMGALINSGLPTHDINCYAIFFPTALGIAMAVAVALSDGSEIWV